MAAGACFAANEGGGGISSADRIAQGRQLKCKTAGRQPRNRQRSEQDWSPRQATAAILALARVSAFRIRRHGD